MLNPITYTEKVVSDFLRYQFTTYAFADPSLNGQMRRLLSLRETRATSLMQGPYVSLSRSFREGASVKEMVDEQVLHPHLSNLAPHEHVYGHQERAIRSIAAGRTTLISTGTGSGKTECFLYPVISHCLKLRDAGAPEGITAVIVYPMNALAEDQLGRLRELLVGTGISFGMYVGRTPERTASVTGERRLFLRLQVLREVATGPRQRLGLEPWGRLVVDYVGLDGDLPFFVRWAEQAGCEPAELRDGAAVLLPLIPPPAGLKLRRGAGDEANRVKQWLSQRGDTVPRQAARRWGMPPEHIEVFFEELWHLLGDELLLLAPVTLRGKRNLALPGCAGVRQVDADRLLLTAHRGVYRCDTCRRAHPRAAPRMACLYDPMPGGSGLLEQMLERWPEVIAAARELVDGCPSECASSCVDCLQNLCASTWTA